MNEINQCAPLLRQIHGMMEKEANNTLRENDLTIAQFFLLMTLTEKPEGACPLKELEKQLQIGQSTTVGLVKRLKAKGFVECLSNEEDKRIKIVRITPEGTAICERNSAKMNETEQSLLRGLDANEQEIFYHLLQKIQKNFY